MGGRYDIYAYMDGLVRRNNIKIINNDDWFSGEGAEGLHWMYVHMYMFMYIGTLTLRFVHWKRRELFLSFQVEAKYIQTKFDRHDHTEHPL